MPPAPDPRTRDQSITLPGQRPRYSPSTDLPWGFGGRGDLLPQRPDSAIDGETQTTDPSTASAPASPQQRRAPARGTPIDQPETFVRRLHWGRPQLLGDPRECPTFGIGIDRKEIEVQENHKQVGRDPERRSGPPSSPRGQVAVAGRGDRRAAGRRPNGGGDHRSGWASGPADEAAGGADNGGRADRTISSMSPTRSHPVVRATRATGRPPKTSLTESGLVGIPATGWRSSPRSS